MKTTSSLITFLIVAFLLIFACKKKNEPVPGDTISMSDLSSELTPITPTVSTTGGTTTGGTTTGGTTTGGTTTGGTTTGGSTTGNPTFVSWTFWTRPTTLSNVGGGIYVYIDGSYSGYISAGYSTAPSCGASGCVTESLPAGVHTWYATNSSGTAVWGTPSSPRSATISASCSRMELY